MTLLNDRFFPKEGEANSSSIEAVLKMWEREVESLGSSSNIRVAYHTLFTTLNTAILGGVIISGENGLNPLHLSATKLLVVGFASLLMCLAWFLITNWYRRLNSTKLGIILELEQELPARPFTTERKRMSCGARIWHLRCLHSPDLILPAAFAVLNAVFLPLPWL